MWVEKTLGLYQHKDGIELPAPKARIQVSATVLSLGMLLKPQLIQQLI